jgi:hypothetical protein
MCIVNIEMPAWLLAVWFLARCIGVDVRKYFIIIWLSWIVAVYSNQTLDKNSFKQLCFNSFNKDFGFWFNQLQFFQWKLN